MIPRRSLLLSKSSFLKTSSSSSSSFWYKSFSFSFSSSSSASASSSSFYETLGLARDASSKDIKTAYYQKSRECHPDLHPDNHAKLKTFLAVSEAYSTLSDPDEKRKYDQSLGLYHNTSASSVRRTGAYGRYTRSSNNANNYTYPNSSSSSSSPTPTSQDGNVSSRFDHRAHYAGHYGSEGAQKRDKQRLMREAKYKHYQEMYESDGIHGRMALSVALSVASFLFIFYSGYAQMIWMEPQDPKTTRIKKSINSNELEEDAR